MRIPSVTSFAASRVDSFLQASWRGKTVQVLCLFSVVSLIYLVLRKIFTRASTSPTLVDRTQLRNRVLPQEIPKPDLSYIKASVVVPDFVQVSGFGQWLLQKIEAFGLLSQGVRAKDKDTLFWVTMNQLHREIKDRADTMKPVFEKLPSFSAEGWKAFCDDCQAIIRPNSQAQSTAEESCKKLDECLVKLAFWDKALQKGPQTQFMERMKDKDTYPHYEFTDFRAQYFHYLGLVTNDAFLELLSIREPFPVNYLESVGLVKMKDIDILELTTMMPLIEKLRQLYCYLDITKDEAALRPLIKEAIEACRQVLGSSDSLSDDLRNTSELRRNVQHMRTLFGDLSKIGVDVPAPLSQLLAQLKKIETQDIARQLILLKGYLHQHNLLDAWHSNRRQGVTEGLAQYVATFDKNSLSLALIYKMGS